MSYGMMVMKIQIFLFFSSVFLGSNGEPYYVPKITDRVSSCDDFENKVLDCDGLKLGSDDDDSAKLSGQIILNEEIGSDCDIETDIWKMMELGEEFIFSSRVNFCASLEDEEAPWYPVITEMQISSCPVATGTYDVHDLIFSLDAVKDVMCHEFIGEYRLQMSFVRGTEKVSCHLIEVSIVEEDDDDA